SWVFLCFAGASNNLLDDDPVVADPPATRAAWRRLTLADEAETRAGRATAVRVEELPLQTLQARIQFAVHGANGSTPMYTRHGFGRRTVLMSAGAGQTRPPASCRCVVSVTGRAPPYQSVPRTGFPGELPRVFAGRGPRVVPAYA